MKSLRTFVYFLIASVLMFAAPAFANNGTFMVVKGDIKIVSKDGKESKAKVGAKVVPSDTIVAGADSRAKVVMADKNVINVSPDTKILIEKYSSGEGGENKEVSLNVVYGKVRAEVNQKYDGEKNKFHVKTPSAVAGVRGTDFLTSYSPSDKASKIVTFEGRVAVGTPGPGGAIMNPVMVNPGQSTVAANGAPPSKPAPVPKEELVAMNTETKAEAGPTPDADRAPASDEKKEEKKDEPKKEEPKKEDSAKSEEPKKEEQQAKADEPKKEEPKKDEPKKETAKADEPSKKEEPKRGPASESSDSNKPAAGGENKDSKIQAKGGVEASSPGSNPVGDKKPASVDFNGGDLKIVTGPSAPKTIDVPKGPPPIPRPVILPTLPEPAKRTRTIINIKAPQ